MKNIAVIGAGRVGLVTAACLAHLGNSVVCIERNPFFLDVLRAGCLPFYEPRLYELVSRNMKKGLLRFSNSIAEGIRGASIIFLAVGTPQKLDGALDVSDVLQAASEIGLALKNDACVVSKSTVPPGTNEQLLGIIRSSLRMPHQVTLVSNPEFLREGTAVADFLRPDRIVIGVHQPEDADPLADLYARLHSPIVITDVRTAELIKSVSNFYLALRVSFANQIADLCDALGLDVLSVLHAVGMDARIGHTYLQPGLGFGGPCLPKDLRGLADCAARAGAEAPLIEAALRVNDGRIDKAIDVLSSALDGLQGRCVCVLGLSFKAGTDDIRDAPALRFIERLVQEGVEVHAHDPMALENFRRCGISMRVHCKSRIDDAIRGADAVAILTGWPQYRNLRFASVRAAMRGNVLFDGANLFEPSEVESSGLCYRGLGRTQANVFEKIGQPAQTGRHRPLQSVWLFNAEGAG